MIDAYRFGRMEVGGTVYESDLLVFPERVQPEWWRKTGHRLDIEDLGTVRAYGPDVVVVGTGAYGVMEVPDATRARLRDDGIRLVVERTADAVKHFNRLLAGGVRVVGAFHLTC